MRRWAAPRIAKKGGWRWATARLPPPPPPHRRRFGGLPAAFSPAFSGGPGAGRGARRGRGRAAAAARPPPAPAAPPASAAAPGHAACQRSLHTHKPPPPPPLSRSSARIRSCPRRFARLVSAVYARAHTHTMQLVGTLYAHVMQLVSAVYTHCAHRHAPAAPRAPPPRPARPSARTKRRRPCASPRPSSVLYPSPPPTLSRSLYRSRPRLL